MKYGNDGKTFTIYYLQKTLRLVNCGGIADHQWKLGAMMRHVIFFSSFW